MPLILTFAEQSTGIVLDPDGRWEMSSPSTRLVPDMSTALEEIAAYLRKYPGAEAWIGHGDLSFRIVLPPPPSFVRWQSGFKASGDLGAVRLGLDLGEVISLLGLPKLTGGVSRKYPCSAILRYERALDFHFDRHGVLFLVHDYHAEAPRTVLV